MYGAVVELRSAICWPVAPKWMFLLVRGLRSFEGVPCPRREAEADSCLAQRVGCVQVAMIGAASPQRQGKCERPLLRVCAWFLGLAAFVGLFLVFYAGMFQTSGSGITRSSSFAVFAIFVASTYNALLRPIHLTGFVTLGLLGVSHIGLMLVTHSARPALPAAPLLLSTRPNLGRCARIESVRR
jgi:hypothetical protein